MKTALTWGDEIPTGVIYKVEKETYEEKFGFLIGKEPMIDRELGPMTVKKVMDRMR